MGRQWVFSGLFFSKRLYLLYSLTLRILFNEEIYLSKSVSVCEISGFRSGVDEFFCLLGCYSALIGSCVDILGQPVGPNCKGL
jgi:hypothetical protein